MFRKLANRCNNSHFSNSLSDLTEAGRRRVDGYVVRRSLPALLPGLHCWSTRYSRRRAYGGLWACPFRICPLGHRSSGVSTPGERLLFTTAVTDKRFRGEGPIFFCVESLVSTSASVPVYHPPSAERFASLSRPLFRSSLASKGLTYRIPANLEVVFSELVLIASTSTIIISS